MPTLSQKYGVSDYALRRFFAEEGMVPSRTSLTPEQLTQIGALSRTGMSAMEVSRRVGAPDSTVRLELARVRSRQPFQSAFGQGHY
ncbi:hypothetical protein IEE94_11965 [Yimella sp. cx-573]|nr:hypothetical protein [Yimella sp. cx-573]